MKEEEVKELLQSEIGVATETENVSFLLHHRWTS